MLHCSCKSKLLSLLENHAQSEKSVNFANDLSVETDASGALLEDNFFIIRTSMQLNFKLFKSTPWQKCSP